MRCHRQSCVKRAQHQDGEEGGQHDFRPTQRLALDPPPVSPDDVDRHQSRPEQPVQGQRDRADRQAEEGGAETAAGQHHRQAPGEKTPSLEQYEAPYQSDDGGDGDDEFHE